jgi:LysM repeat protein
MLSTAHRDGDVVHEVKYGQRRWSIVIQYGTRVQQIKRLNNLTDNIIVPGWKLSV